MKPSIRTYLCNDENHRFFGEGPRQLLHAIDETGSLRSAALSMNMAYTKALRIIRSAEATLGFPLTVRTTGGKGGGGSQMTAEAREFLAKYEAYRDACTESGQQLYEEFFCRRKSVSFSSGTQTPSFTCLQNSYDVRIACIIMASGLGKRFGSNKLMASFHGAPLIHSVLDEKPVLSCSVLAARADGHSVTTLEGLQEEAKEFGAFIADQGAEQCGFCNPGFIMNALALFREKEFPEEDEIREYLAGNLCRCSGYEGQLRGILAFLDWKREKQKEAAE